MRDDLGFIIKPVILVGKAAEQGQAGAGQPTVLDDDDYNALPSAAPLSLGDLAAILTGRKPFELEPGDDRSLVADWEQVVRRLQQAVGSGQLPDTPTLCEGVTWAGEVGCPMVNAGRLKVAACLTELASAGEARRKSTRISDWDPELQRKAEMIAAELIAAGRPALQKVVASKLIADNRLTLSLDGVVRRIRTTWQQ